MGSHSLHSLFNARSVAVFGASERAGSVGTTVFANLLGAKFSGDLFPINPKHRKVRGQRCYPNLDALHGRVELALVTTPAASVPDIIRQCGNHGVKVVVVLSAGFGEAGAKGQRLQATIVEEARRFGMRLVGPNCLGVMRPKLGLNATFSRNQVAVGSLALVSQSGAICTAVLDWADAGGIGFSAMVSLGDVADVDFGDVLDYLALDGQTRGILIYIEGVREPRRFLSGLRAAARLKPVTVLKAARHERGVLAAHSHTGVLIANDDVFTAALERAGVVRVTTVSQLFASAQTLARAPRPRGERLLIVTNGGGPGVMAVDRAEEKGVPLATLSDASLQALDALLPAHWSHGNPVDLLGDATPERYRDALRIALSDLGVDTVLVMLTPQAMTDPEKCAQAVIEATRETDKYLLACWMGDRLVEAARLRFDNAGMPHFKAPEAAVEALGYVVQHRRNQAMLMQTPGSLNLDEPADVVGARLIIDAARVSGRNQLTTRESKAILAAFRIPTNPTILARTPNEAMLAAETLGFPVALKICAPRLAHKTDVGGVRLNVSSAQTVMQQTQELLDRVHAARPDLAIEGVTVEHMHTGLNLRELFVGVTRDPVFGPVIAFGAGGLTVEVLQDRALALPPLNSVLAERLIRRTRVSRLLGGFRNLPPVPLQQLEQVLLRVSEMACELPEIEALDINPLLADERGVLAVDAHIEVRSPPHGLEPYAHMAIHPYPSHLTQTLMLGDGVEVMIRPIRPEDAPMEQGFVRDLSDEARFMRFMQALTELTPDMLVRFTQIDYDREMAFVALADVEHKSHMLGVARYFIQPDGESAEFAIVVADAWQGRGIGTRLMEVLMKTARGRGLRVLDGEVLARNRGMLRLSERLGFSHAPHPDDRDVVRVSRRLG
ncbi:MAG: GNAT family N-acetyltransferase [Thiotrichales bacterium]